MSRDSSLCMNTILNPERTDNHYTLEYNDYNNTWQKQLKDTINNIYDLCTHLDLDYHKLNLNIDPKFPIRIPKAYLKKISKNTPDDPLLLQVLPLKQELEITPNYYQDPLSEHKFIKAPGLIHKYKNRVLLTLTSACGIHCRYCFRQHFPYNDNIVSNKNRELQLDYIKLNININEIILSGGDPLCVNNKYLDNLFMQLSQIDHIKIIRFHTRMPIVIPDRIDQEFINILNKYNKFKIILVTHCNHPNELDAEIKSKMELLIKNNITLFNQSVLLKNINNCPKILTDLSYKLFDYKIIPYYLHLLDQVQGASHFDIEINQAKQIMQQLKTNLPGYLVPKLVKEIPGEVSKTVIV